MNIFRSKRIKQLEEEKTELYKTITEFATENGKLKERLSRELSAKCHIRTRDIVVHLDLLRIPKNWTSPSDEKLIECEAYYQEHGDIDRTIVVNKNGYLIDGYAGYLTLKKHGIETYRVLEVKVAG